MLVSKVLGARGQVRGVPATLQRPASSSAQLPSSLSCPQGNCSLAAGHPTLVFLSLLVPVKEQKKVNSSSNPS